MGTSTTNYLFQKPTDGGDDDVWGTDFLAGNPLTDPSPGLNGNWSKLDLLLQDQKDRIAALDAALDGVPEAIEDAEIKIGGLYITTSTENPGVELGYGTWALWLGGRTLVSVGDNGESVWSLNALRGADQVILTEFTLPYHQHTLDYGTVTSNSKGEHDHGGLTTPTLSSVFGGGSGGSASRGANVQTDTHSAHTHGVSYPGATTDPYGGGLGHNNVQPSKAAFIWERTA